ncbi:hypothetical protein [Streptococcus pluranimalium]|uniref:ArsR/SmtB family transcription factor n=1 Tax=Streptococcus pluranimalium TaxID=82348 RepID=UPI003139FFB4
MNYHYHEYRSRIVDQLLFPLTADNWLQSYSDILTQNQRLILQEEFQKLSDFEAMLKPYHKDIETYFLSTSSISHFAIDLYLASLNNGHDPKTIEDFLTYMSQVSDYDIKKSICRGILQLDQDDFDKDDDIIEQLEARIESLSLRWRILWAYHHPTAYRDGLVSLYRNILPLYQPYHELTREECFQFGDSVDVPQLYKGPTFDLEGIIEKSGKNHCELFIVSNWYPFIATSYDTNAESETVYCFLYPKVERLLKEEERDLTEETLALTLKTLGDETRYQVLLESLKDDVKSKDIANKLGITSANVTFHTQKLINASILLFATDDSSAKYRINRSLLKEIIERLQNDFEL